MRLLHKGNGKNCSQSAQREPQSPLRASERKDKMEHYEERMSAGKSATAYQADICRMVRGISDEKLLRRLWLLLIAAQK